MKLPIKKGWVIVIALLLLLIFLNPGYNAFREYTGLNGKDASSLHKEINGLVFSVYENTDDSRKYVGFCLNFIPLPEAPAIHSSPGVIYDTSVASMPVDSTKPVHINGAMSSSDFSKAFDAAVKEEKKEDNTSDDTLRFNKMSVLNPLNKDSMISRYLVQASVVVNEQLKTATTIYRRLPEGKFVTRKYIYQTVVVLTEGNKKSIEYKCDPDKNKGFDRIQVSYLKGDIQSFMIATATIVSSDG